MCGICGIIDSEARDNRRQVDRLNDALRHRGPDHAGRFDDTGVSLGTRRLRIVDPDGADQPITNEDGSIVVIANGEIYNHVELRAELAARGHRFNTTGDIEVIVHLYEDHGDACVDCLRGMFAFALWDRRRRRLLLARDRMGEKPLYMYSRDGRITFASEMGTLLRTGSVPFEINADAVHAYFHFGYVPEPATIIAGVRKLPAGCRMAIDVDAWDFDESTYWSMDRIGYGVGGANDGCLADADIADALRSELERMTKLVIRSDVPIGVTLSGGLDSSLVAALAAREYPHRLHAFCVGYPGRPPYDERDDARRLADHLRLPFHEIEIKLTEMVATFGELCGRRDDPIADIAGHGYYVVAAEAARHDIRVLLMGQGGDELFWGYPWMRDAADLAQRRVDAARIGRRFARTHTWVDPYADIPHVRDAAANWPQMYTDTFIDRLRYYDALAPCRPTVTSTNIDARITQLACERYLRCNGIAQADRLAMASSVEVRLPLVDHVLVERVSNLRRSTNDRNLLPKQWLRDAARGLLPDWVIDRPKRGFAPPLKTWHHALFDAYGRSLDAGLLVELGILNHHAARELAAGPFPDGVIIPYSFKALVLETWCRSMTGQQHSPTPRNTEARHDADRTVCV